MLQVTLARIIQKTSRIEKKFTTGTTPRPILLLHYKQVKTIIKVKAAEEKKPFKTAKGNNAIHKGLLLKYIHPLLKY